MFLNGMAQVAQSHDDISLGKAYVRYLITNSLTCQPFQGSRSRGGSRIYRRGGSGG